MRALPTIKLAGNKIKRVPINSQELKRYLLKQDINQSVWELKNIGFKNVNVYREQGKYVIEIRSTQSMLNTHMNTIFRITKPLEGRNVLIRVRTLPAPSIGSVN